MTYRSNPNRKQCIFSSLNATPMLIDTALYGEHKTGINASGLIISSFTLAQKIGAGLAQGVFGIVLA